MATLTIRNLDDAVKEKLRVRAAEHGRSMESEVRDILHSTLMTSHETGADLFARIRARFAAFGGLGDLELPLREQTHEPPVFE